MPKKKKSGKKKAGAAAAVDEELKPFIEEFKAMRAALKHESAQRNLFQLERDKVSNMLEVVRQRVTEVEAEVRSRERSSADDAERHATESRGYKQRIKHLLFEHNAQMGQQRTDDVVDSTLQHESQRSTEEELVTDERALKVALKEKELAHFDIVKNMRVQHDKLVTRLREDYERQARELHARYEKRMKDTRTTLEDTRRGEIQSLEDRKDARIDELIKQHQQELTQINNYYRDLINANMDMIRTLKNDVRKARSDDNKHDKDLSELVKQNKELNEPYLRATAEAEQLRLKLDVFLQNRDEIKATKASLARVDGDIRQMQWEHEVLTQQHVTATSERDGLRAQLSDAIYESQRRHGLENLVLEKKHEMYAHLVEKAETQLGEALLASELSRPELDAVSRKLEDVLSKKDEAVGMLRAEIARVSRAHADLVRMYQAKMAEHGLPIEELGFKPRPLDATAGAGD